MPHHRESYQTKQRASNRDRSHRQANSGHANPTHHRCTVTTTITRGPQLQPHLAHTTASSRNNNNHKTPPVAGTEGIIGRTNHAMPVAPFLQAAVNTQQQHRIIITNNNNNTSPSQLNQPPNQPASNKRQTNQPPTNQPTTDQPTSHPPAQPLVVGNNLTQELVLSLSSSSDVATSSWDSRRPSTKV